MKWGGVRYVLGELPPLDAEVKGSNPIEAFFFFSLCLFLPLLCSLSSQPRLITI